MDKDSPALGADTRSDTVGIAHGENPRGLIALSVVLALAVVGLSIWGLSERSRADDLAKALAAVEEDAVEMNGWSVADLSTFESAFESGDYEEVRALFTDDGILTTAANTHWALYRGEKSEGEQGVNGAEFRRIATLHRGEDLMVLGTPIQVGDNTIAFAWQWGSGWVSGTCILHLRDGKIVVAIFNPSQFQIPLGGG